MLTSGPGLLLRGMSGSVVLLLLGSVLISKTCLTTKDHIYALSLCCHMSEHNANLALSPCLCSMKELAMVMLVQKSRS